VTVNIYVLSYVVQGLLSGRRDTQIKNQVFHVQRIILDKFASRFNHIAHEFGEQIIGLSHIINLHLQQ
mgnify:CR=1